MILILEATVAFPDQSALTSIFYGEYGEEVEDEAVLVMAIFVLKCLPRIKICSIVHIVERIALTERPAGTLLEN